MNQKSENVLRHNLNVFKFKQMYSQLSDFNSPKIVTDSK